MSQATKYEILYIIRPDLTDDAKKELVERFNSILTENGTEVVESKRLGEKNVLLTKSTTTKKVFTIS